MNANLKLIVAASVATLLSVAVAQTTTDSNRDTDRTAGETARDAANAVGRAASAAVTPGDQNMGRTPDNRSGGVMGTDPGTTGADTSTAPRMARTDRG